MYKSIESATKYPSPSFLRIFDGRETHVYQLLQPAGGRDEATSDVTLDKARACVRDISNLSSSARAYPRHCDTVCVHCHYRHSLLLRIQSRVHKHNVEKVLQLPLLIFLKDLDKHVES